MSDGAAEGTRLLGVRLLLLVDALVCGGFLCIFLLARMRLPTWPDVRTPAPPDLTLAFAGCGALATAALARRAGLRLLPFLATASATALFAFSGRAANDAGFGVAAGRFGFALHLSLGILAAHGLAATALLGSGIWRNRPPARASGTGALLDVAALLGLAAAAIVFRR